MDLDLDWIYRDGEMERMRAEQKETLVKGLDFSAEKGKEEMARMREGMAELLDERVGDCVLGTFILNSVQVAEVKEQLHQQLGQVEAQLVAQKKVILDKKELKNEMIISTGQENETRLDELNYMMEERLAGLQRGLTDQIDGVTG